MATAQLPDGSTVELPEYASEATLSNLLSVMSGMSAEQQTSWKNPCPRYSVSQRIVPY